MNAKNFSLWISCFVVVCDHFSYGSCLGQDKELAQRIAAGKKFLTPSRITKWESHFTQLPQRLGRIVYISPIKKLSECWLDGDFRLVKRPGGEPQIEILNEKYYASVVERKGTYSLEYVRSIGKTSGDYTVVPVTSLPFAIPSSAVYYAEVVPSLLKNGRMVIDNYRQEDNRHYFTFVFTDDKGRQPIDMVFDEGISYYLPVETTFRRKKHIEVLTSFDFTEINGYNIPLQFSVVEQGGKNQKYTIRTDVYPGDRLDREKCYLSFYGLPEPPIQEISDFGRRGTNIYLVGVIVVVFLLMTSFAIHRIRRSQR